MAKKHIWLRPSTHLLLALPLLWISYQFYAAYMVQPHQLGANPVEYSIRYLGIWALRILILTLAITPLVRLTGYRPLMSVRRAVGLWAFAYALLHLGIYQLFDLELSLPALWQDVLKRKYITFGMAAVLMLIPLAATSTSGMIKRLGARNWQRLHRAIYIIGIAGGVHFLFMRKGNQLEPKIYLGLIIALLIVRLLLRQPSRRRL
jgi:methionine sulfoxide reductase heme-binding subunit